MPRPTPWAAGLVARLLQAQKEGVVDSLLQARPTLTRRLAQRCWPPPLAALGHPLEARPWLAWLRARLASLRPDRLPGIESPTPQAWMHVSGWRPYLALACHQGLLRPPALPGVWRGGSAETPAQALCAIWGIGPSTYYRCLDKARHGLAHGAVWRASDGASWLWHLGLAAHEAALMLGHVHEAERRAWHRQSALDSSDAAVALWHHAQGHDLDGALSCLRRHRLVLATHSATRLLLDEVNALATTLAAKARLGLAAAGIAAVAGDEAGESAAYAQAMKEAVASADPLREAEAYAALGKFNEVRDPARALACYESSLQLLGPVPDDAPGEARALRVNTLTRLAYQRLLRNDPGARAHLDEAERLRAQGLEAGDEAAQLEQCWGEYWRRANDVPRAIEHKQRALRLYEALGDIQAQLKTWVNLGLLYSHQKDFVRSEQALAQVLNAATRHRLQPDMLSSTHLNLGATCFEQGHHGRAIQHYRRALDIAHAADLRMLVARAHFNLAEAYFKRFQADANPVDERLGDAHVAAAQASFPTDGDPSAIEATQRLKSDILGPSQTFTYDRLLSAEFAAHPRHMAELAEAHALLSGQGLAPRDEAQQRINVVRAHLQMAAKERAAAIAMIDAAGLRAEFEGLLLELQHHFAADPAGPAAVAERWRRESSPWLPAAAQRAVLLELARAGQVDRRGCVRAWGVSPATASLRLAQLVKAGLLVRHGQGASTHYRLPDKV